MTKQQLIEELEQLEEDSEGQVWIHTHLGFTLLGTPYIDGIGDVILPASGNFTNKREI